MSATISGRELGREMPDAVAPFEAASARAADVSAAIEGILSQDLILPPDGFWDRRDANRVAARLPAPDEDLLAALPDGHPLRAAYTLPARFGAAFDESARSRWRAWAICTAAAPSVSTVGARGCAASCSIA